MLKELFNQPENRKLEFKENIPPGDQLARTIIAFSNNAGGEIYLGIKNKPRQIVGLPENELFKIEEQISNTLFDLCAPVIVPDISFINVKGKHIILIKIFPGSQLPYYLKSKGRDKGTFIRVGSSNRVATDEIIQELERKQRNITFDSLPLHEIELDNLDLSLFSKIFAEKTGKKIDKLVLQKLNLVKRKQKKLVPTVAAVLLSDNLVKNQFFPYAKVECARFKGVSTSTIIDQYTCDGPLFEQIKDIMTFIKRNINRGATIGEIYRKDRWEYPINALRELLINAVIHRDYSQQGRDIKVAIYDDMLEITSPGTLPPAIDINELESGQSEIRNRVLAPIFKMTKLIEQWGTGFSKVRTALKEYPEIEIEYLEPGLSFQVQLKKKEFGKTVDKTKYRASTAQVPRKYRASTAQERAVLMFCRKAQYRNQIQKHLGLKHREHFRLNILNPLLKEGLISMTIPDNPNSPKQKYFTTEEGLKLLKIDNKSST